MQIDLEILKTYLHNIKIDKPYFEESQWKQIATTHKVTHSKILEKLVRFAQSLSQSPVSNFKVGAVGIGESNKIYFGTNIELEGFPLNQSIHAEQALVAQAFANQEESIKEIHLSALPCGHCRQFLRELYNFKNLKLTIYSKKHEVHTCESLLPHSFGPLDLGIEDSLFSPPHLIVQKNAIRTLNSIETISKVFHNDKAPHIYKHNEFPYTIKYKILDTLNRAFAPYSKCPSGVLIEMEDNRFYSGSYIESCAFNPSLNPFHMAYAQLILGNQKPSSVKKVYLIEIANAKVKQLQNTLNLCHSIFTKAEFIYLQVKSN